jgi:hypothetical protein
MGFFKWLYRLPGRIGRDLERTAIADSVMPGRNANPQAVNLARGEFQQFRSSESSEEDAMDTETGQART